MSFIIYLYDYFIVLTTLLAYNWVTARSRRKSLKIDYLLIYIILKTKCMKMACRRREFFLNWYFLDKGEYISFMRIQTPLENLTPQDKGPLES